MNFFSLCGWCQWRSMSSGWLYSEPLCFVLPEQLTVTCSWGWSDTRDGIKSSSALIWRDSSPTNHLHTCVFPNLHSFLLWNTRFYFGKGFHCFCPCNESQWDPEEHWTSFKKHKYHRDFFVCFWCEKINSYRFGTTFGGVNYSGWAFPLRVNSLNISLGYLTLIKLWPNVQA